MTKTITFTTRKTPNGCTATVIWQSGRTQTKRFRNGYACSELSAKKWINEQIATIEEMCITQELEKPNVIINGEERKIKALSQDEIWTKWKAGDIHELRNTLNDMAEGENTFFEYVDAGVGYPYPTFVCGDEAVFDRYQRALIERSQASSLSD